LQASQDEGEAFETGS